MTDTAGTDGLRARISKQSEDTLGRLAQELLESPLVTGAVSRAFGAREKAAQAQEVAMGALNIPSAGDLERLTRRVRSVSQRFEGVEDGLDRVEQRIQAIGGAGAVEERLAAIEQQLSALATQLADLGERLAPTAPKTRSKSAAAKKPAVTRTRAAAASKRAAK